MKKPSGDEILKARRMKKPKQQKPKQQKVSQLQGRWWAEVTKSDGSVERTPPKKYLPNMIVANAKVLLAALLKNDVAFPNGIAYHAVGEGDPNWDTLGVPGPSFTQDKLLLESFRKVPTQIVYIDGVGDPTATPTNIIRVKTIFETTDLPPAGIDLREHGLFGGDATGVADSGLMIDVINMSSIWKDNTVTLTLYIELEF